MCLRTSPALAASRRGSERLRARMSEIEERLRVSKGKVADLILGACQSFADSRSWSAFDLAKSLDDTWNLSGGEDCCYDRASHGPQRELPIQCGWAIPLRTPRAIDQAPGTPVDGTPVAGELP